MKNLAKTLSIFILTFFLAAGTVGAATVSFYDNSDNWPNWNVKSGDLNGTPDFQAGTAEVSSSGYLTGLTFDVYANTYLEGFIALRPGDLFIDSDADTIWDYVVKTYAEHGSGGVVNQAYAMYEISQPLGEAGGSTPTDSNYILASASGYRIGHPTGLNLDTYDGEVDIGDVELSGWWDNTATLGQTYQVTFGFLGETYIYLGEQFTISFMVSCANDVVYETLANPVPEPASMLLLGTGLTCMAGIGRKKFGKS